MCIPFDTTGVFSKVKKQKQHPNAIRISLPRLGEKKNMNRTNNMTENPRTAFIFNMLQLYELIRAYFPQEEKS